RPARRPECTYASRGGRERGTVGTASPGSVERASVGAATRASALKPAGRREARWHAPELHAVRADTARRLRDPLLVNREAARRWTMEETAQKTETSESGGDGWLILDLLGLAGWEIAVTVHDLGVKVVGWRGA